MGNNIRFFNSVYDDMSKPEKEVANYLKDLGIYWQYESPIFVTDNKNRPRIWTPDFYLPELGIYIEVCGAERKDYSFRMQIYEENKIPIIFVHTYKSDRWKEFILKSIKEIYADRSQKVMRL